MGPESQLVGHNFQQEFLSELETGTELLQTHAQLVLGNALSHAVQGAMEAPPTEASTTSRQGDEVKVRLELHCIYITFSISLWATYNSTSSSINTQHDLFFLITLSIVPPDRSSLGKCVCDQRFSERTGPELLFQPA